MRRRFTFVFFIYCLLAFPFVLYAQDIAVTGKITDQKDGSPLPGVTIKLNGSSRAASTDPNGVFTIQAPVGGTLTISLIGMNTQTVTIPSGGKVNVSLTPNSQDLTDVVVIGYGVQKKSVVTGAISSVRAADLENQPTTTRIEQALQGRTSGLTIAAQSGQPGSASTVRLRGFTSFGGKNDPLWVIDGVVVDNGGIGYLNQADIESIEVLKDAASAAIYGARAASGVIIVTTKKGKQGKIEMSYNGYYGQAKAAKKLDLLNATEYATLRNEAYTNDYVSGTFTLPFANPAAYGEGTDWQSTVFNDNAGRQNHEFSISGGGEKSTFYLSAGYFKIDGIVAKDVSKFNRANIRINSTHRPYKWLTIGENLGYSHAITNSVGNTNSEFGGPLSSAINLDPITPAIITDPAVAGAAPYSTQPVFRDQFGNPYGISTRVAQEITNPLGDIRRRIGNYSWDHNIVGNAFLEAEPIKGLRFRSTLGSKLAFYGSDGFNPIYYLNSSTTNTRTQFSRNINYVITYNLENTLSYTRSFGNHNLSLLVGQGSYSDGFSRSVSTTFFDVPAQDFYSASMRFKPVATNRTSDGSEGTDHKVFSLFSRLTYDYKEKYLFSALIRRDGSSRFGANNKYGYFPSGQIGWVPTKEDFFPQNKVVNFLKLRASYGVTGNDGIGDFAYVPLVGSGRNYTFGNENIVNIGYSPAASANPDLKWEETRQTNIGIDATLFENVNLVLDWYKKKTVGILQNPPVPGYIGSGSPAANIADMSNSGFEFELGYRKKFGEINFGISGNGSFLKNRIDKLSPGINFIDDSQATFQTLGNITRTQIGHSYNEFFGYVNQGIFQSQAEINAYRGPNGTVLQPLAKPGDVKFANLNNDEAIDVNDRDFIGNGLPKFTYGITLNLGFRNWDLIAFGSGVAGNMIFQGLRRLDIPNANYQTSRLDRWTPTNPSATQPRLTDADPNKNLTKFSSLYLEKGDYFRLRTFQIGYTLPKSIVSKVGLQKFRVYVLSENLFTATKYTGYDPELGSNNSGNAFSIDRGLYPQARSFVFGINANF
ncbi:SusC/RagA family TonB-linked outer membrane protein [Pedobacter sp. Leaf41]|jgi:TonB-linked SusC/RagA family outer membrane protein|uniref:SusC/RagA family TonB-linked outer membrane protein n=1 Tax=Pedobacter sp. Leaf41 TaxID=1736218 RepID=UPI000703A876|nr:TonB-dependent receptor [Pedobacter sp. Leaf41]KQN39042.1 SusC/RagA family TonB-linked outer membrane protein [Pedobacter sp. Leaf41]